MCSPHTVLNDAIVISTTDLSKFSTLYVAFLASITLKYTTVSIKTVILSLVIMTYLAKSIMRVLKSTERTLSVQGLIWCRPGSSVFLYFPKFSKRPAKAVSTYIKGKGQQQHMHGIQALRNPKHPPQQLRQLS